MRSFLFRIDCRGAHEYNPCARGRDVVSVLVVATRASRSKFDVVATVNETRTSPVAGLSVAVHEISSPRWNSRCLPGISGDLHAEHSRRGDRACLHVFFTGSARDVDFAIAQVENCPGRVNDSKLLLDRLAVDQERLGWLLFELSSSTTEQPGRPLESPHSPNIKLLQSDLIPISILELTERFRINQLSLSLSRGRWEFDRWSEPVLQEWQGYPRGTELSMWLEPTSNATELTNTLAGIFCGSLNRLSLSQNAPIELSKSLPINNHNQSFYHGLLPIEQPCTENLSPLFKLLPCGSHAGLSTLIDPHRLFEGNWNSIRDHLSKLNLEIEIETVLDQVRKTTKRDWDLSSIFGKPIQRKCGLTSYCFTSPNRNEMASESQFKYPEIYSPVPVNVKRIYGDMVKVEDIGISIELNVDEIGHTNEVVIEKTIKPSIQRQRSSSIKLRLKIPKSELEPSKKTMKMEINERFQIDQTQVTRSFLQLCWECRVSRKDGLTQPLSIIKKTAIKFLTGYHFTLTRTTPIDNKVPDSLKQTLPVPDITKLDHNAIRAANRWILTFGLINFDLDEGPDFDNCYPPSQMSNIAFSSFPDCAKSGSLIFSWRIPGSSSSSTSTTTTSLNGTESGPKSSSIRSLWIQRDPTVLRGYNQRSLVLITHLVDYVGPLYASQGAKSIDQAFKHTHMVNYHLYPHDHPIILTLPDPTPGSNLELNFMGQDHKFIIPLLNQAQILDPKVNYPLAIQPKTNTNTSNAGGSTTIPKPNSSSSTKSEITEYHVLASNPTTYLSYILFGSNPTLTTTTTLLSSSPSGSNPSGLSNSHHSSSSTSTLSISSLWLLWEILILAEPLVVFGNTPDIVSDTVLHLKNLIRPIPFHANWRPYITIHDPDFGLLFGKNKARAVGLIGATNPIILTSTHAWPNVLSLSQQGASFNHQIGLLTDRKRVLHKNKSVVKQLLTCLERKDYHNADIVISRHFSVLTEQFLQPLQRYFTTLLPTELEYKGTDMEPQRTGSFNSEQFLKSLKEHTTALEFRSRLMAGFTATSISVPGFYTAFLRSPNFSAWLNRQLLLGNAAVQNRFHANNNNHNSSRPNSKSLTLNQLAPVNTTSTHNPSSSSSEPLHHVIKKLQIQLSKRSTSSGLSPTTPSSTTNPFNNTNPQPQQQQSQRKKEGNNNGAGKSSHRMGSKNRRSPSDGSTSMMTSSVDEEKKQKMGMIFHGLKKSRTISGAGSSTGNPRVRRSSSTISNASSSLSSSLSNLSSSHPHPHPQTQIRNTLSSSNPPQINSRIMINYKKRTMSRLKNERMMNN
ncbi:hypothetical protein PSHT_02728 [Puccinia striiformis]|uniref:UDENN domain-containing protein n=1 Tax=Puccinia striiformis TaxID=27350 RepID=A0A2S4WHG7_9BASI|nr:hypothetical protein PSHT_02728 [Puccinia striiformis]